MGQSHGLHVLVEGSGLAQLDQHDVIVDVVGVIVGVVDDTRGGDELLNVLAVIDVVLSKTHLNMAGEKRDW